LFFKTSRGICVVLQPASSLAHARLVAATNNLAPGEFTEDDQLDKKLI
jgi:hypothetical protein